MHSPVVASQPTASSPKVYCNSASGSPQQYIPSTTTTLDTCIFVQYFDEDKKEIREHSVYAHRVILSKSPFFGHQLALFDEQQERRRKEEQHQQISSSSNTVISSCSRNEEKEPLAPIATLRLDLSMAKDALHSFKVFLNFLYGGPVNGAEANPERARIRGGDYLTTNCSSPNGSKYSKRKFAQQTIHTTKNKCQPNEWIFSACTPTQNTSIVHPNIYEAYLQIQSLLKPPAVPENKPDFGVNLLLQNSVASSTNEGIVASLQKAIALFKQTPMQLSQQQSSPQATPEQDRSKSTASQAAHSPILQYTPIQLKNSSSGQSSEHTVEHTRNSLNLKMERGFHLPLTNTDSNGSQSSASTTGSAAGAELLVPSNDKEGWCRNKKYIQIVKKGYRCIVCNKVYGRYNSVSYHVTIYHRNPPIKCEEDGCQFTTREARYIHFHKYYRHQIPLPDSIDLASRKCPLSKCKHVSKSPAMLDKHIHRHVTDCLKDGIYKCSDCLPVSNSSTETSVSPQPANSPTSSACSFSSLSHEEMFEHLRTVHGDANALSPIVMTPLNLLVRTTPPDPAHSELGFKPVESDRLNGVVKKSTGTASFRCELCNYRGRTLLNLEQHKVFKHSTELFNNNSLYANKRISSASETSEQINLMHHTEFMDTEESPIVNTAASIIHNPMQTALTSLFHNNSHRLASQYHQSNLQHHSTSPFLNLLSATNPSCKPVKSISNNKPMQFGKLC
uniref:BTB domain-containing protein n=1 Tax=Ditylenchus dipsaci TaxID=166011 RepID=A0A915E2Z3_9BILA